MVSWGSLHHASSRSHSSREPRRIVEVDTLKSWNVVKKLIELALDGLNYLKPSRMQQTKKKEPPHHTQHLSITT